MDIQELKERIIIDEKIEDILNGLGMHSVKDHEKHVSCGFPDGDNKKSTVVYKDSLHVDAHTRNIEDIYGRKDIISLVTFVRGDYLSESLKWICDLCGYDYYGKKTKKSRLAQWVKDMKVTSSDGESDDEDLLVIDESILKYFGRYSNPLFREDGVCDQTQWEFELGYDLYYHMITIPIRDELGSLVGVKGRLYKKHVRETEDKYFYIQPCAKSKILYGLNKTLPYIKRKNEIIVVDSEKAVQQLWSMGIRNAVAIGGHMLSKVQVQKLTHLNVSIVLAFDEGCEKDNNGWVDKEYYKKEFDKFLPKQKLFVIYDRDKKILNEKESPSDNPEKWVELYSNYKFSVRGD